MARDCPERKPHHIQPRSHENSTLNDLPTAVTTGAAMTEIGETTAIVTAEEETEKTMEEIGTLTGGTTETGGTMAEIVTVVTMAVTVTLTVTVIMAVIVTTAEETAEVAVLIEGTAARDAAAVAIAVNRNDLIPYHPYQP